MPIDQSPTAEDLEQLIKQTPFAKIYNFQLVSHGDGQCTLRVPFSKDTERPGGLVAGPVYMACADVAMWLAIISNLGKYEHAVTTELSTKFLSSAREEPIICTATVLKLGRTQIFGVAECRTEGGKLLTHHSISYARTTQPT